jgi:hypothetical protein
MDLLKDRCKVRDSRKRIKLILRNRSGGSVMATFKNKTRILSHDPMRHAPINRLPWPLSLIQPHKVGFMVMQDSEILEKKVFMWGDIDLAINQLLEGISEDEYILVSPH